MTAQHLLSVPPPSKLPDQLLDDFLSEHDRLTDELRDLDREREEIDRRGQEIVERQHTIMRTVSALNGPKPKGRR